MPQLDEPTPQNMTIPGWEGYVPDARVFAEFEPQTSPASPSQKPPCARFDWPARNAPPIGHKSDRRSLVGRPDRRRVAGPGSRESRGNFHFSPQRSRLSFAAFERRSSTKDVAGERRGRCTRALPACAPRALFDGGDLWRSYDGVENAITSAAARTADAV